MFVRHRLGGGIVGSELSECRRTHTHTFEYPLRKPLEFLKEYGSTCHQLAVPIPGDLGRAFFRFDMGKFNFSIKRLTVMEGGEIRTRDRKSMSCRRRHLVRH